VTERQALVFQEVCDRWESRQLETTAQDLLQALPDEIDDERKARATLQALFDKHLLEKRNAPPSPTSPDDDGQAGGRPSLRYRPAVARARRGLPTQPPKPPKPPEVPSGLLSEPTTHTTSETSFTSSVTEVSEVSEGPGTHPCAREPDDSTSAHWAATTSHPPAATGTPLEVLNGSIWRPGYHLLKSSSDAITASTPTGRETTLLITSFGKTWRATA
jgi:hypothetical protein